MRYSLQPVVIPASIAHLQGTVAYADSGEATLQHGSFNGGAPVRIPADRQFPLIFATFMDLSKALSSTANSPKLSDGRSLREQFDEEFAGYRRLVAECEAAGRWEPDYGSYVFDATSGRLFLVAPEYWHRIALTASSGSLLLDVSGEMHWARVRECLETAVVGIVGASVGSNVLEGVCRELRPRRMKIADPDWVELSNLNRLERVSIEALVRSRSARSDPRNPFELHRYNKAEVAAYQQNLVDPYAEHFVYASGIDEDNMDRFLLGEGDEPRLDLVVEEADDLQLKVRLRKRCRELGIPVLMMSDFGHMAVSHFQDFARNPQEMIAYECDDLECFALLDKAMTGGNRDDFMEFVRKFVGGDCIRDEFESWVNGAGEQPTSSLPQSGATAMASGGIAAKIVARYLLGYRIPSRVIHDLASHSVEVAEERPRQS
jgi:molybdopterin/thiamine biosynthesis adenylyltransferase